MKRLLIFFAHLVNGALATPLTGWVVRGIFLRLKATISGERAGIDFEVSSFVWAFVLVGLVAGFLSFSKLGGKGAFWVWLFPLAALSIQIFTFPAESVFGSGPRDGWNYFFGKLTCSSVDPYALVGAARRCLSRMLYLGPCWSAIAYSTGALGRYLRVFEFNRPVHS